MSNGAGCQGSQLSDSVAVNSPGGLVLPLSVAVPFSLSTSGPGISPNAALTTGPDPPPRFTSALLGPASPSVFTPANTAQSGITGLTDFSTGGSGRGGGVAAGRTPTNSTSAIVRTGLLVAGGGLASLAGLGSPGAGGSWRSPSWRNIGALSGLGSPGATAGARTTQAAAELAPQGLLAGLASPPGPRGTGPKHNTLYKVEL